MADCLAESGGGDPVTDNKLADQLPAVCYLPLLITFYCTHFTNFIFLSAVFFIQFSVSVGLMFFKQCLVMNYFLILSFAKAVYVSLIVTLTRNGV
jgi:hypothetical protein